MNRTKILKIGAEGGSLNFYRFKKNGEIIYSWENSDQFSSVTEMIQDYCKNHDPLLWYFPVEIDLEYSDLLMPILQGEVKQHGRDYFPNLEEWERKLNRKIEPKRHDLEQTFIISPVVVEKKMSYNHIGDERILDAEITEYNVNPKQKKRMDGIGSIEGNTFVIRDGDSVIKGIFPMERYDVEITKI